MPETPLPRPVDALAERFVEEYAAVDPLDATYLGIPGYDDKVNDLSPDGYQAREQLTRRALQEMVATEPVDEREKAAKESFVERMTVRLEQYDAKTPQSQVSVIFSELHNLRGVFDLMSTDGEEAWAQITARLRSTPEALAGYRATLLQSAAEGHVSAKRQIDAVAAQVRAWTGQEGEGGNFFQRLAAGPEVPKSLRGEVADGATLASEAYTAFGRFLTDDLLPHGRDRDGVGRERYEPESRYFLGARVDLDETYAWGWEELSRIEDDMTDVARQISPDASVDEAVAVLDDDPARLIRGKENFRAWMQELADRTIEEMDGVHFDIPEPVRRIECRLAPTNDGGIYYTGPSEDFSRPGRMWWAVPDGITDFSTWREVTTVYHEGVPGHHLQVAQTAYRSELLNRWQRTMCWVSGHGEGWALYAERLMDDLGYLDDPGNKLGMLDAQSMRAARVIIDIGMHLELEIPADNPFGFHPGETWTPDLGLEFLRQHCRMDDAIIRFEVNRYLGWPGQAPSYKVGERIWLQARADVQARKGADFDLKDFHRTALDLGSLGLDPLRAALSRL
ncbi:MAG: DUF885 domain-containing protein [Actinomycetota bacterium]|nr:DUF885 domain-containing protein [Actinomycetota bacterium]